MDDSVNFSNKPNLLYFHWKKKINNIFKQLVEMADIHLSISEAMSDEYFIRYKKYFKAFRNPIDIDIWAPFIKTEWSIDGEIRIIYTGRLAVPNVNALLTFCKVVEAINNSDFPIQLHIYSIDKNEKFTEQTSNLKSVVIHDAVAFEKIPSLITGFDIALLPIDFTKKGIEYARYSISTKTSEYMISGVPILLFAPKQVALTKYAEKNKTMHIVTENSLEKLTFALKELISNEKLRTSLALKAISVAKSESDALQVRKCFREVLYSIKEMS
jgi:glycosyltransferase involved in cell wall biosynthesis